MLRRRLRSKAGASSASHDRSIADRDRREAAAANHIWFHSIDLGHDVVTPGVKPPELLASELSRLQLPDLHGRSVLDIGAWDGFFSFAAERLGAERVVALDHYAWSIDIPASQAYLHECWSTGAVPAAFETVPTVWRPDTLPGRQGFDTARELLGSRVEAVVVDFMSADAETLGRSDVVLFLGVLYHLQDPFAALRQVAALTAELAVIETVCIVVPGCDDHAVWEFFETDELNGDPTNWWAPNIKGLVTACRSAGFSEVDVIEHPVVGADVTDMFYGRAIVHAKRTK